MDSWSALERVRDGHAGDPDDLIYCDGSGDGGIDLACLRRAEPARVSRPPRLTLRYPPSSFMVSLSSENVPLTVQ
jgi:hypothetical protein